MSRPVTNTIKISQVRVKQKNGDTYVLERKTIYDPEKGYTKSLGTRLIGKIPLGQTEMVPTRPRKGSKVKEQEVEVTATRTRVGLTKILDWIGKESGIDEDLFSSADIGDAQKALTLARYFFATEGQTIPHLERWQFSHETPYAEGLSESICSRLFETLGRSEGVMQNYFMNRANRLDTSPSIAYDSTTISTYSRNQIEARQGFNKAADGLNTIKLLTLYSVDTHQPIAFAKQPGNLPDVTSVKNALKEFEFLSLKNPLIVTDNGYYSQSNLTDFTRNNTKFLTLGNLDIGWIHRELEANREKLKTMSSVCPWDYSIHGITVSCEHEIEWTRQRSRNGVCAGEKQREKHRYYLHFYHNLENASRDERRLIDTLMELRDDVLSGHELVESAQRKADKYLVAHHKGCGGHLHVGFNEEAIAQTRKDYGYFVLVSNKAMDPFDALKTYRLREKIEEAFKVQKDRLDGTRVRVWDPDRLRGRMFVQFIALGYYCYFLNRLKELEITLGVANGDLEHDKKSNLDKELGLKRWLEQRSVGQILDWFDSIKETSISTPMASIRWSTESTERDRLLLKKLGIQ